MSDPQSNAKYNKQAAFRMATFRNTLESHSAAGQMVQKFVFNFGNLRV